MSTVAEIEAAIEKLPSDQLAKLFDWIDEFRLMVVASENTFALYDEERADAKSRRAEIWIAALGLAAKVRPVVVLSVTYRENERAVVSYVPRALSN